jgi:hypothetical protein
MKITIVSTISYENNNFIYDFSGFRIKSFNNICIDSGVTHVRGTVRVDPDDDYNLIETCSSK